MPRDRSFRGYRKAVQTTLHTQRGTGLGPCNQWGCGVNWGKADHRRYGQGRGNGTIDSTRPFNVTATFDLYGAMAVELSQGGATPLALWDEAWAGNGGGHVPAEATAAVKQAMGRGVVLVTSLWAAPGDGGMAWLDGGCDREYPHCDIDASRVTFSDLRIEDLPPPLPPLRQAQVRYRTTMWDAAYSYLTALFS